MTALITLLIVLIALFHVFAFCMESLLWQTPSAMHLFNTTTEDAVTTRVLALNQGVYNLFLAAGLAWSLIAHDPNGFELKIFFLACVIVAGIVGGFSVSKRVLLLQAFPALITLLLVVLRH